MKMKDDVLKELVSNYTEYKIVREAEERRFYLTRMVEPIDFQPDRLDLSSTSWIVEQINEINRIDKKNKVAIANRKPIKLYINCYGGEVVEGFALVDAIELSKTPVWTINVGRWSSMGFHIGIVGKKRISLPRSVFLLHDGFSVFDNTSNKARDEALFSCKYDKVIMKKNVLEHSKMTGKDFEKIKDKEYYMLPEEALKWGFIDKIAKTSTTFCKTTGATLRCALFLYFFLNL